MTIHLNRSENSREKRGFSIEVWVSSVTVTIACPPIIEKHPELGLFFVFILETMTNFLFTLFPATNLSPYIEISTLAYFGKSIRTLNIPNSQYLFTLYLSREKSMTPDTHRTHFHFFRIIRRGGRNFHSCVSRLTHAEGGESSKCMHT